MEARRACAALGRGKSPGQRATKGLVGLIEQTPPMYSARKVEGKRLYELARAGEEVERVPRAVNVDEVRLTFFQPPDAGIFVRCSKGTYLRTLAHVAPRPSSTRTRR